MNERINELHEQAHSYACEYARRPDYNPHNPYNEGMYKERYVSKFAELIVRECAKFLDENSGYDESNNAWHPEPEDLLKHFGVEE